MNTHHHHKHNNYALSSPGSIKTKFTLHFLKSLKKLNRNKHSPSPSQSIKKKHKRCQMIKIASYSSMALAVGPRRMWSRTTLWKIKNRSFMKQQRTRRGVENPSRGRKRRPGFGKSIMNNQESELRKLVPGGEGMGFGKLLSETAHYVMCLRAQVMIMKNIVDRSSA